ncbi:MAG: hydantoinase/oxoprolinase family protein [Actinobacteria bacterium]|nr:hydantoinase/oxoprolinase family protein [Actinomycetota bacterium]
MIQIGLDVGGTFTDVVEADESSGATRWLKVPTNVESPSQGVLDGIAATGVDYGNVSAVRLGTTLGVNALLTSAGSRTGLITTRGFRDVLEIRRTHRKHLFDLDEEFPTPLVPRDLRKEVTERVDAEGNVVRELDEDELRQAWRELRAAGVSSVAIVFLFSFENPEHERRARELVEEEGGAAEVFLSSDVLPAYREYERTSTTVAAARIAGTVETYLRRLGTELVERGLGDGRLAIMTNSGGALSATTVAKLPISTLLSGPVGGVEASRWLAAREGWHNVLTMDMGGTSCDVSGVVDGQPDERLDMEIGGHTISYPTYDIETIGAGGGSIAWIDSGGSLRVGPRSAGSSPGPACYGRGGTLPTVTDANLVLGRYDGGAALGGTVKLDAELSRAAIRTHVAEPLGMTVEGAAAGILRIVNVLMTNAVRVISVERGRDVRDFTLVAYGGAGPTHAADIARELSIPRILIPPLPGCTSAFGAVISGSRRDFLRTVGRRTDRLDVAELAALDRELREQAVAALEAEHFAGEERRIETWLDVRYEGQAHELAVQHEAEGIDPVSMGRAVDAFHDLHEQLYGHAFRDVPVEVVNLRVKGLGHRSQPQLWWDWGEEEPDRGRQLAETRPIWFEQGEVEARVYLRRDLAAGDHVAGPAVIHQTDTTIIVPPDFAADVLPSGSIVLSQGRVPGGTVPSEARALAEVGAEALR